MPLHIQITDDANLAFWCSELGVSPRELVAAVQIVGGSARFVAEYLRAGEAIDTRDGAFRQAGRR